MELHCCLCALSHRPVSDYPEGIGLSIDENYSIIQECYPYLASRLFTDRNPRAKKALKAMLGIQDDETEARDSHSASTLVQQATLKPLNDDGRKMKRFSPGKLAEMTEGFASYTSATGDVNKEKGQLKAAKEFTKLFLDPKGSTLQDIFVDETAKYGDAMARRALRAVLVDNAAAKAASTILKGPKQALERNQQLLGNSDFFFPSPLKSLLVDRPAAIPDILESLLASTEEDEMAIETVEELGKVMGQSFSSSSTAGTLDESTGRLPRTSVRSPASVASTVSELLSDDEMRQAVREQLPGVVALSRRLGAGLLRRAAYRTERAHELPEDARRRITEVNRVLADVVEPKTTEDENEYTEDA
jgi:aarF domain-containing kinase